MDMDTECLAETGGVANPQGDGIPCRGKQQVNVCDQAPLEPSISQVPLKRPYRSKRIGTSPQPSPSVPAKRMRKIRKPIPAAIGGAPIPRAPSMLKAPSSCPHCGAKKIEYESKKICCADGEIKLASNDFPDELVKLFTLNDPIGNHFRTYSRLYNNVFAFTSLGGKHESKCINGIYVFKAHGQVYHNLPDLLPRDDIPRYLQLYFYDAEHEKENRLGLFSQLKAEVISALMAVMNDNPYAKFFRSLREVEVTHDTRIVINSAPTLDQRVYNSPTCDEVAGVWPESSAHHGNEGLHIVAYGRSGERHRVRHYYGCYDALQYPLLLPKGDCGWHQGLKKVPKNAPTDANSSQFPFLPDTEQEPEDLLNAELQSKSNPCSVPRFFLLTLLYKSHLAVLSDATRRRTKADKRISCREYYAYKLQIRTGNFLLQGGRIFQQFVVDMYVKLENTRLDFLRTNQDTIRADLYQGILDTLYLGENCASNVGRRFILPPSFLGGPRDMGRRYLNSMGLVQRYGKPDLFLTMTCNPNWAEFKGELRSGELIQHRPDLVARVFNAKLIAMRKQIMEKKVFGEVAGIIHVVEFQKRGLPHAHFLIILKDKIQSPEDFDKYVCAEIPSMENEHLRAAVVRHMMHGPCGSINPDCPCMKAPTKNVPKVCKNKYPRKFCDFTTTGPNCYPLYRRRDTGETIEIRRATINNKWVRATMDNRWVIPYNPYLLAMFDCHINVEVCSTVKAVKYLYKYVYKGHDRVSFNVTRGGPNSVVDEIENFQSGRWVSPPEAAWRLFGFNLFDISPPVQPLPVHTPNKQLVRFQPHETLEAIVADEQRTKTMLTAFFHLNALRPTGPKYLYSEFPEHFVWDERSKSWKDRKRGVTIGRVAHASPGEGERFYLRLLLAHVRGPTSFIDLLTVEGFVSETFQEAALKRGLLDRDDAPHQCMDEAVQVKMPQALRRLFATILIFSTPNSPKDFWEKYYEALAEDYRHQYKNHPSKVLQMTAQKVEQLLEGMGKTFADYNLEHLHTVQDDAMRVTRDIEDALCSPIPDEHLAAREQLNLEQRTTFKAIMEHVENEKPGAFFIDGPGGTGKTFLYCALYAEVRSLGKICLPTATSGIAASNLPTGRTAHSRFKIPLDSEASMTCDVAKQGGLAALLRKTSLIIWDEASMAKKENIEAVNLMLQDVCGDKQPFGGKIVVFGGDFRQVLPVLPRRAQCEAVEASVVSCELWPFFQKFRLTENVRARADPHFSDFLLNLGNGKLQSKESELIYLPASLSLDHFSTPNPLPDLVDTVFPEIREPSFSTNIFSERAILTPRNNDVDLINKMLIDKFPGNPVTYKSFDSVVDDSCNIYPAEFLNSLCPTGMTPHELVLKKNAPVILLRNLDPAAGLCNGTRLICKQFFPNMIECQISTGYYTGEHVFLPRITLRPSQSSKFPINFQRKQFPIKLSFAMTINKAQGQTLQRVGVYLPKPCFSHGQLYVALSRARTMQQLKVLNEAAIDPDEMYAVKNVVSFEILRRAGII